jgi:hypothetical protein
VTSVWIAATHATFFRSPILIVVYTLSLSHAAVSAPFKPASVAQLSPPVNPEQAVPPGHRGNAKDGRKAGYRLVKPLVLPGLAGAPNTDGLQLISSAVGTLDTCDENQG